MKKSAINPRTVIMNEKEFKKFIVGGVIVPPMKLKTTPIPTGLPAGVSDTIPNDPIVRRAL